MEFQRYCSGQTTMLDLELSTLFTFTYGLEWSIFWASHRHLSIATLTEEICKVQSHVKVLVISCLSGIIGTLGATNEICIGEVYGDARKRFVRML